MRNFQYADTPAGQKIAISSDFAAGIGEKEGDKVKCSYDLLASMTMRVVFMEMLSGGGSPFAVTVANGCYEDTWNTIEKEVTRTSTALGYPDIVVTGSTESNIELKESSLGITVIGEGNSRMAGRERPSIDHLGFAVIGEPLSGDDVIELSDYMVPLHMFKVLVEHDHVWDVIPGGSKGVAYDWQRLIEREGTVPEDIPFSTVNLYVSCGPSSAILISYDKHKEDEIYQLCGSHFHPIQT